MDISGMSEEEQLRAAIALSMQDVSGGLGGAAGVGARPEGDGAVQGQPRLPDRGRPRSFPGKSPQDVLPACPRLPGAKKPRSDAEKRVAGEEARLADGELADLLRLLFTGAGAREDEKPTVPDIERWLNVGFRFSLAPGTEWGLWQRQGGPCGIYAPVQGFIVKALLFGETGDADAGAPPAKKRSTDRPLACADGEDDLRAAVVAHALSSVLYQATPSSTYLVCEVAMAGGAGDGAEAKTACASAIATGTGGLTVTTKKVSRIADAQQVFEEAFTSWLAGPCGVLSFVCSVLLSRGVSAVKEDMDDMNMPLIGRFGHCSQELVNLMLVGEAVSNVFDGARFLGDDPSTGLLLSGISGDRVGVPHIGFLSAFEAEATRKLEVGTLYKYPEYPVWVLGSATHYTIVFSTRREDSQLSREAQVEQHAKQAFNQNSLDDGGLAMASSLPAMLQALNMDVGKADEARRELVREDIILWEDFRLWARRQFGCPDGPAGGFAPAKIGLFQYDGQDPPGPSMNAIALEVNDIDPRLAGGGSDGDDLAAVLHTRWPNAAVQVTTVAGAGAPGGAHASL